MWGPMLSSMSYSENRGLPLSIIGGRTPALGLPAPPMRGLSLLPSQGHLHMNRAELPPSPAPFILQDLSFLTSTCCSGIRHGLLCTSTRPGQDMDRWTDGPAWPRALECGLRLGFPECTSLPFTLLAHLGEKPLPWSWESYFVCLLIHPLRFWEEGFSLWEMFYDPSW